MFRILLLVLAILSFNIASAQSSELSFISYGNLPTWSGVAVDWNSSPKLHIYDTKVYQGHSEFVARGLGRKIRFSEFKKLSKESKIRLENYNYDDKPNHLAEEVLKLNKMVSELDKSFSGKGLIILTEGDNSPLGVTKLGKLLTKSSESYITLNQLLKHVGGKKMEVLNPGTAYGFAITLRYFASQLFPYSYSACRRNSIFKASDSSFSCKPSSKESRNV